MLSTTTNVISLFFYYFCLLKDILTQINMKQYNIGSRKKNVFHELWKSRTSISNLYEILWQINKLQLSQNVYTISYDLLFSYTINFFFRQVLDAVIMSKFIVERRDMMCLFHYFNLIMSVNEFSNIKNFIVIRRDVMYLLYYSLHWHFTWIKTYRTSPHWHSV